MVDLFISTVHCKYSSIILQKINLEEVKIHDISKTTIPDYITSVPTLVYNNTLFIGYDNILYIINTELSHIKIKKKVEDILESLPKPKKKVNSNQVNKPKSLIDPIRFKPGTKGFGEILPHSLKTKTSQISYSEKEDLKSSFDEMMKKRDKL